MQGQIHTAPISQSLGCGGGHHITGASQPIPLLPVKSHTLFPAVGVNHSCTCFHAYVT